MENQEADNLLFRYLHGEISPSERMLVESWYMDMASKESLPDTSTDFIKVKKAIWRKLHKKSTNVLRYAAAAVFILAVGFGFYFYRQTSQNHYQSDYTINDIKPGGNKALLILSDGKKISLSDVSNGRIANQSGVQISKTNDGQLIYKVLAEGNNLLSYNTTQTPNGGTVEIQLPDGSSVWLNAASSLKYPTSFFGLKERKVELIGEAYFEVSHNKNKPFKVVSQGQEIEVLGTHFNVNSYENASIKTTLLEGSIRLTSVQNSNPSILKPDQEAVLERDQFKVTDVDAEDAIAWKQGLFLFDGEKLSDIMKQISRWYDVQVVYDSEKLKSKQFSGSISRFNNVSLVLKKLETVGSIKFTLEKNKIIVYEK